MNRVYEDVDDPNTSTEPIGILRRKYGKRNKMRSIIMERDGGKCIYCKGEKELDLAHVLGLSKAFQKKTHRSWEYLNSEFNLIMLCNRCHAILDDRYGDIKDDPRVRALVVKTKHDPDDTRTWTESTRRSLGREFNSDRDKIIEVVCRYLGIRVSLFNHYQGARFG